jgi:protein SCO1/2
MKILNVAFLACLLFFLCCKSSNSEFEALPFLGNKEIVDGKEIAPKVGKVNHFRQDSVLITNDSLEKFIYVTDFFFTSCPSICPKVMKEMLKLHEEFKNEPMVKLVSFTIDPRHDTASKLKLYGDNLEIDHNKWWFLTGDKDETFELANTYFIVAKEDKDAPGGFDHSGMIVLVDREGHVRSFSQGTDPGTTQKLIDDIKTLVKSYQTK